MVFQNYALFPHLTVEKNIAYGLKIRGWDKKRQLERTREMLQLIRLDGMGDRLPSQLSGGQQQRVALARALAFGPGLLLTDETLGALDRELRIEMAAEMRRIHRELGNTILYVTHDQEEALTLSDRVIIMRHGKVVAADAPRSLYERPATAFVARFFSRSNLIPVDEVIEHGDVQARVSMNGQSVTVPSCKVVPGTRMLLAVRPENAGLERADAGLALMGKVEDALYLGDVMQISIATERAGRMIVRKSVTKGGSPHPGDSIMVSIDPSHAMLVRDDLDST
jgi:putative spermidine/putrescine transport system ATP-binding protein